MLVCSTTSELSCLLLAVHTVVLYAEGGRFYPPAGCCFHNHPQLPPTQTLLDTHVYAPSTPAQRACQGENNSCLTLINEGQQPLATTKRPIASSCWRSPWRPACALQHTPVRGALPIAHWTTCPPLVLLTVDSPNTRPNARLAGRQGLLGSRLILGLGQRDGLSF